MAPIARNSFMYHSSSWWSNISMVTLVIKHHQYFLVRVLVVAPHYWPGLIIPKRPSIIHSRSPVTLSDITLPNQKVMFNSQVESCEHNNPPYQTVPPHWLSPTGFSTLMSGVCSMEKWTFKHHRHAVGGFQRFGLCERTQQNILTKIRKYKSKEKHVFMIAW